MPFVIHAPNVHQGGGRVLLLSLLKALADTEETRALFVDVRMDVPNGLLNGTTVYRVAPRLASRFTAEWKLRREVCAGDTVLCFGNLPPLFKLRAEVSVFVQNLYLIRKVGLKGLPFSMRVRITMERKWLTLRRNSVDRFIVQTPSMKRVFEEHLGISASVLPFSDYAFAYTRHKRDGEGGPTKHDFLYVASGEPHKNHRVLIDAWCLMAEEDVRPSLYLTIDKETFPELCSFVESRKKKHDLRIENKGELSREDVERMYAESRALIYPSTMESVGLPLIEARCKGLPIVASELDYVRDVIDPEESFDPTSPLSIARAVKRFLGIKETPLPLLDAQAFIQAALRQPDRRCGY